MRGSAGGKRLSFIWGATIALLVLAGFACWFFVVPVWKTRGVIVGTSDRLGYGRRLGQVFWTDNDLLPAVTELGGPEEAARKLAQYVRVPEVLAPRRSFAMRMMRVCGEPGHRALVLMLSDESVERKEESARVLGWIGDYRPKLDVSGRDGILEAISISGKLEDPRCYESLLEALGDESTDVRGVAATALGLCRWRNAASELEVRLKNDTDPQVRRVAAWALGRMRSQRHVAALRNALKDSDRGVRVTAEEALGRILMGPEDLKARQLLERYGEELGKIFESMYERGVAVSSVKTALAAINELGGPSEAAVVLARYARLPDELCPRQFEAVVTLACCGRSPTILATPIDAVRAESRAVYELAPGKKTAALRRVVGLLAALALSGSEDVSYSAIQALGWLEVDLEAGLAALRTIMADDKRTASVRQAAREALEKIKKAQQEKQAKDKQPVETPPKPD